MVILNKTTQIEFATLPLFTYQIDKDIKNTSTCHGDDHVANLAL